MGTSYSGGGGGTAPAASSTDNAIARFDGTTGAKIQNSGVTVSDANAISGAVSLGLSGGGGSATSLGINGTGLFINDLGNTGFSIIFDLSNLGADRIIVWPNAAGTITLGGNTFSGTGNILRVTSPVMVTPTLGVASATSLALPVSTLQTAAGNGETINTAGIDLARYTANGAARTGVILAVGTFDGQTVTVINEDTTPANSITFAAVATSHVANGVTSVINGLQGRRFVWSANATTPAWYELK